MRQVLTSKNIERVKERFPAVARETIVPDGYVEKLLKYIPAEVVTLYVTVYGIAKTVEDQIPFEIIIWLLFVVGIIATITYLWRIAKVDWSQIATSTIAFAVWVFALGGPFIHLSWYHPIYGALLLPIYTFFIPVIVSK